jgi:hypothetical protein
MIGFLRIRCLLAVTCLLGVTESRAQPFTNGGFEIVTGTPIPANSYSNLNVGDTWLTGWSAGGPNDTVIVQNGMAEFNFMGPWQGAQWVIFPDSTLGGSVSQTFQTSIGNYYAITFESGYVSLSDEPLIEATIEASNGMVLSSLVCGLTLRTWTGFRLAFVAATPTTTLTFTDVSAKPEGSEIGLDGVSVTGLSAILAPLSQSSSSNSFVMQLEGQAGQSYIIQTSTNLAAWSPVSTNTLIDSSVKITNTVIPGAPRQFWKAVPQL